MRGNGEEIRSREGRYDCTPQTMKFSFARLLPLLATLSACQTPVDSANPDPLAGLQIIPYGPEIPSRPELGAVMVDCERHLRTWQELMVAPQNETNRHSLEVSARALTILVKRERAYLEEQAVSGPDVNRGIASASLGFLNEESVLPLILNNITVENPGVTANALLGLGILASPQTPLAPLQAIIRNAELEPGLAQNAAWVALRLAQVSGPDAEDTLASMLLQLTEHANPAVRAQATVGLGLVKAEHAASDLIGLLEDDSPTVRVAAAFALGEVGSIHGTRILVLALSDEDALVAGTAHGSLVKIHGTDFGPNPADWAPVLLHPDRP